MSPSFRLRPLASLVLLAGLCASAQAADLMQAYELARQSDPQLAAAESAALAQGEGIVQSRAALLPQISADISLNDRDGGSRSIGTRPNPDGSVSFGESRGESDTRSRSYGASLNQSLYNRASYTRLRASRARAERANADYQAANHALMLRVAESYFNVLTAVDSLVFARAERRAVKRQLDQAEQRFEVGLTAITDVHEARALYDNARANTIAAENALDDAREALSEITGRYLIGLRGLGDAFTPMLPDPANVEQWVEWALAQNPSLLASEYALIAAGHDIDTARAAHLPTLGASVSWNDGATWGRSGSNGVLFPADSASDGHSIGVSLRIPIFEGFATQSQVRQAVHNRDAVGDQYEQSRRSVTRQTRNAYRALDAGISEVEARMQALVSARSALEATEAGFEVGTRTIVDVLLSQQQLFQAQRNHSSARHAFMVNTLRLKQAAGVIDVGDIQEVNRFLTEDAEAALAGEDGEES